MPIKNVNHSLWHSLRNKTSARDTYVATAENMAREALNKIEKCEIALPKAAKPENHDQIIAVRNKIKTFVDHINRGKDELYRNKDLANMSEKYWKNVREIYTITKFLWRYLFATQARAEGERSSHQAPALWAACQALWCSVRTGEPGTH
uniref:MICOS complex subunit MIC60 n=1 Tax=Glossina morsitans morsitans TaxID=37546 RepID=A0A1B0F9A5_GLOMM